MPKYRGHVPVSAYRVYEVEADSEEEALELINNHEGEMVDWDFLKDEGECYDIYLAEKDGEDKGCSKT